jgi:flagellar hook protein FlgE
MAGFSTAVTGLKASTTMLDVAGNNIANSSTVGFKSSRTEFGDIYATAVVGAGSSNSPGSGVTVTDIAQDFSAGTIEFTNNNLDLAINGSGFFQLDDGQGGVTYTRAGAFELDKSGNIISKTGKYLQGYGLDADGNRLPIDNMTVTEKESPPKATENIDLSFNIDAREDPSELLVPYDKDEPASFSYTHTVRSFDSLGNEHRIKYNFVEQRPQKEVHLFDTTTLTAGTAFDLSETTIDLASNFNNAPLASAPPGTPDRGPSPDGWDRIDADVLASLQVSDDRIFDVEYNSTTNQVRVVFSSDSIEYGNLNVTNGLEYVETTQTQKAVSWVSSNEKQYFQINGALAAGQTENITIGGVDIQISASASQALNPAQIGDQIEARRGAILDANPEIENVRYVDTVPPAGNGSIEITYKAEAGNVDPAVVQQGASDAVFVGSTTIGISDILIDEGDNSFQGVYRTYAYLNNDELLNMGKPVDPGDAGETEVGPVLLKFDPTNGLLTSVNGNEVTPGAPTPKLTILGADPADPDTQITLDLDGSTQFASASIVKGELQDGYTKGDLIGVTFSPSGEMVASYSNGENQSLGVVAIATFENQAGLQPSGDTEWAATLDSGDAILNPPGTGLNGTLRSAALEASNVDLSEELVKLIEGQRNYQANSKTLETLNAITQTILQI